MAINTVSKEFFEEKYRSSPDPWQFASSHYELNRYDDIMRLLRDKTFHRGFEPGCSIGVLTERLAKRCRHLVAMDISPSAVAMARKRCSSYPHVTILEGAFPDDMPPDRFDLVVFSEIGYYFGRDALARVRDLMITRLMPQGVLIGAHWLGVSPDHLLRGDEVHDVLRTSSSLKVATHQRYDGFLLESWERL